MSNSNMRANLRQAAKLGRGGDDRIAHINGYEAAVLKALGGAGTPNPKTGLLEFRFGGSSVGDTSEGAGDPTGSNRGGTGGVGGNGGKGVAGLGFSDAGYANKDNTGYSAPGADKGKTTGRSQSAQDYAGSYLAKLGGWQRTPSGGWTNPGLNKQAGIGGNGGATVVKPATPITTPTKPATGGTTMVGNDTTATKMAADKAGVSPDQYNDAVGAYSSRVRDFIGTDDGLADTFGNFLAGMGGFNETEPDFNVNDLEQRANWSFDPAGLIGGIAGMAGGLPIGAGLLADQLSAVLGRPLAVNLGPSVFEDPVTGLTTTTGSSMTVQDDREHFEGGNDNNPQREEEEYLGVPIDFDLGGPEVDPGPSSATFYGRDPAAPKPTPTASIDTPLPEGLAPTELPSAVATNVGNTGWDPQALADIFRQWGTRIYGQQNREPAL